MNKCKKKNIVWTPPIHWERCTHTVARETAVFCAAHAYAEDTLHLGAAIGYPPLVISEHTLPDGVQAWCIEIEAGRAGWEVYAATLFEPHYHINRAAPRVTQTYRAIVAYCDRRHFPIDALLETYFQKYVFQALPVSVKHKGLHVVKRDEAQEEIPF